MKAWNIVKSRGIEEGYRHSCPSLQRQVTVSSLPLLRHKVSKTVNIPALPKRLRIFFHSGHIYGLKHKKRKKIVGNTGADFFLSVTRYFSILSHILSYSAHEHPFHPRARFRQIRRVCLEHATFTSTCRNYDYTLYTMPLSSWSVDVQYRR